MSPAICGDWEGADSPAHQAGRSVAVSSGEVQVGRAVAAQLAALAISERTYRTQVAELHRAVAERLEKRLREANRVAWRVLVGAV